MISVIVPKLFENTPLIGAFTTRHGGVSKEPFKSANFAFHVHDNQSNVIENHRILSNTLGYSYSSLVHMKQIHSDKVLIADPTLTFDTPVECDALITNHKQLPLMVMSADCTPVLLYDESSMSIGVVHAGRAGALNKILIKAIEKMVLTYNADLSTLKIVLGPAIHGCCYEINATIAEDVTSAGYSQALHEKNGSIYLDVNTILMEQLRSLNIIPEHIEIINRCTACESNDFFSYRADAQHTGRIAGIIALKE